MSKKVFEMSTSLATFARSSAYISVPKLFLYIIH